MKALTILFLFSFLNQVLGYGKSAVKTEKLRVPSKVISSVCSRGGLSSYKWGYNATAAGTTALCGYVPAVGSMLICFEEKFGAYSSNFNDSVKRYASSCSSKKIEWTQSSLFDLYSNATDFALSYNSSVNYTTTKLYQPIIVPMKKVNLTYNYFMEVDYNLDIANTFSGVLYLYFVFIFILYASASLLKRTGLHRKFNNPIINWYRANISIPATFNNKHTDAKVWLGYISTLVPTRVETIVIFFFICLNVCLTAVNYHPGGTSLAKVGVLYRDIANRTGVISFGLIPLLIIFAGRNNVITTLTGIPYSSMVYYHKWVARAMWIHAVIHSATWTGYALYFDYLTIYAKDTYWIWGVVATIIGGFIMFQAFHCFRTASYEVFLLIHIVLVIIFIVGCYWHAYDLGYLEWLYASWSVWVFDRVLRIVKIAIFGIKNADIEFVGDETFKMTVPYNKWFDPFPGSYGFIYFYTKKSFFQSHPFTIMKSVEKEGYLTFYIKEKDGITKEIHQLLRKSETGKIDMKVSVEGPYGKRAPTEKYDKVLLFAGGNGIPGLYSHIMDLSSRDTGSKQQLKLFWVVRSLESLSWFSKELEALASTQAEISIYVTQRKSADHNSSSESKHSETEEYTTCNKLDFMEKGEIFKQSFKDRITFFEARPNVDEIISQEFQDSVGPSVAVMSCGPPKMVDQVRASTANHLQKSKGRIDLFEELQVW